MYHCKVPKFRKLPSWPIAELSPFPALLFSKRSTASLPKQMCSIHIRGGNFPPAEYFPSPLLIQYQPFRLPLMHCLCLWSISSKPATEWDDITASTKHITRNSSWDAAGWGRSESLHANTPTHTNKCNDGEKPSRRLQHAKLCMLEAPHWSKERGVQAIIRTKLQNPPLSSNIGPILRFCSAI